MLIKNVSFRLQCNSTQHIVLHKAKNIKCNNTLIEVHYFLGFNSLLLRVYMQFRNFEPKRE